MWTTIKKLLIKHRLSTIFKIKKNRFTYKKLCGKTMWKN